MAKTFSGKEIVRILSKQYGFEKIGVSGSHVKMRKKEAGNKNYVVRAEGIEPSAFSTSTRRSTTELSAREDKTKIY